jgi:two-component system response regulator MprA
MTSDDTHTRRLIVLDDDRDLADALCQWIRVSSTWIAEAAYDFPDALAKASACPPDAILLDLEMPGADGFDAGRLPGAAGDGHAAIVALTGDPGRRDLALRDRRFSDALLKPADLQRLLGLLARLDSIV